MDNKYSVQQKKRCAIFGTTTYEKDDTKRSKMLSEVYSAIDDAINDGYTTFLTSCLQGTELSVAQHIINLKGHYPNQGIKLVIVIPFPEYECKNYNVRPIYNSILEKADYIYSTSSIENDNCFKDRDKWIVKHCQRVIVIKRTKPFPRLNDLEEYIDESIIVPKPVETIKDIVEKDEYPVTLSQDIFLEDDTINYSEIADINIERALNNLTERQKGIVLLRYKEKQTLEQIGVVYGVTKERIRQLLIKSVRILRSKKNRNIILGIQEEGPTDKYHQLQTYKEGSNKWWTLREEIDLITEFNNNVPLKTISNTHNRTVTNTSSKISRLIEGKISRNDYSHSNLPWKEYDLELLESGIKNGLTLENLSRMLSRSVIEIYDKICECYKDELIKAPVIVEKSSKNSIQTKRTVRYKNDPPNGHQPWSKNEENKLIEEFNSGTEISEIAKLHQRTTNAIVARCKKIGLIE